jgi:membrane associated rhomboid family serine protease
MLTASYLHGSTMHLVGNLSGLVALGQMIEAYDRRLRVPLAYLAGVLGGSLLSVWLTSKASIGASGGVLGLAGYLLVLAYRRRADGALWLRKRLIAMLGTTAVIGVFGFFYIDNAAHVGGVLAGALVGMLAAPTDTSAEPGPTTAADAAGWVATAVLCGGAVLTVWKLLR